MRPSAADAAPTVPSRSRAARGLRARRASGQPARPDSAHMPDDRSGAEQRHVDEAEVRRRQPREHQRGQRAAARQTVDDADDERAQRERPARHVDVRGRAAVLMRDAGVRVQPRGPPSPPRSARATARPPSTISIAATASSNASAQRGRHLGRQRREHEAGAEQRRRVADAPQRAQQRAPPRRPARRRPAPRRRPGDRDRARDARPSPRRAAIRRTIPSRPRRVAKAVASRHQKDAAARKYHWSPPGAEKPCA